MKTVLLVEDNRDVLELTADMLQAAGYEVVAANGSEQAMQVAAVRADIGIILTDLNLNEGMSGIEMGVAMYKDGLKCPLIVMSGNGRAPRKRVSVVDAVSAQAVRSENAVGGDHGIRVTVVDSEARARNSSCAHIWALMCQGCAISFVFEARTRGFNFGAPIK